MERIDLLQTRGVVAVHCRLDRTSIQVGILALDPAIVSPGLFLNLWNPATDRYYPVTLTATETPAYNVTLERRNAAL